MGRWERTKEERMKRSRWKRRAEEGGGPGGARCRALVGGPGHGLLVPCEEQPLAPGPQMGLPLCCRLPPLPAATTSPSPLRGRRLPARPPARCPPALGLGAGGEEMREGGRLGGRQARGREAGRERREGIRRRGSLYWSGLGAREKNADEGKALHWMEGPPPGHPLHHTMPPPCPGSPWAQEPRR